MMGHLNSFSASGGGNFPKIFQKFKCPGGCPGRGCLSFDLTDTLLNTGTEWNGTGYTGMCRNIPERGRMTPE